MKQAALVAASEDEVRAGTLGLETFEWQAPGFYLKHGYRELVKMPGDYQQYSLSLMVKEL